MKTDKWIGGTEKLNMFPPGRIIMEKDHGYTYAGEGCTIEYRFEQNYPDKVITNAYRERYRIYSNGRIHFDRFERDPSTLHWRKCEANDRSVTKKEFEELYQKLIHIITHATHYDTFYDDCAADLYLISNGLEIHADRGLSSHQECVDTIINRFLSDHQL